MRRVFLVVLLLALAGTAQAIDIKGKWGLGVGIGPAKWRLSEIETSLIRGKTERTAWILDLKADQTYSGSSEPSVQVARYANLSFGPRIRRFTRPKERLSPYWDVYAHTVAFNSSPPISGFYNRMAGVESGLAGGVEYFTPWHFTLAAHTDLFTVEVVRLWSPGFVMWTESATLQISPALQLRVYF
jgi:hypothetical protein